VAAVRSQGDFLTTTHVIWRDKVITSDLTLRPGDATKGEFTVLYRGDVLEDATVIYAGACLMDDDIELAPGVVVEPGALIKGPTMVGERTEVRQGAYVRGSCCIGRSCVVGHATEMKNSVMLDQAKAGHFAYVGDSILGRRSNLGAGTKLANLKIMPWPIKISVDNQVYRVDRRKFGAILGDGVETGCNSVTSPGTVMGIDCLVAPNMTVPSGYHPPRTFVRIRLPKTHGSRPIV
jgi:NDP-sugar pyrophosphorylase family protein